MGLHEYQLRAVEWIQARPKCALWVDMGLGKTVSTLTAILALREQWEASRVLVLAPKKVALSTWTDEIEKWDHIRGRLTAAVAVGSEAERLEAIARGADVTVVNRDVIPWLIEIYGDAWPWDTVIIDESSSVKNASTKRFKALRKVRQKIVRLIELTGTPSPNSYLELWPQIYLLDGGKRLGRSMAAYKSAFFTSDYLGYSWTLRPGAEKTIQGLLSDLCLTLRAEDWLELPPRVDNVIPVDLSPKAAEAYRTLERDYFLELGGAEILASSAGVLTGKLLQIANGAIYTTPPGVPGPRAWEVIHSEKLDALEEILDTATGPALVAYNFQHDLERLRARFPKARVLDGPATLKQWNEGKIDVLLAHPASAGHGLNLQAGGSLVIWFSLTWSLENYLQFNARLHRQGQTKTVVVHHLAARGTIDEDVLQALRTKKASQDDLLNALKRRAARYQEKVAA